MGIRNEIILRVPFEIGRDTKAEFADDKGPVAAAIIVAGFLQVGGGGIAGSRRIDAVVVGVFEVAVVVIGGIVEIREVLSRVTGAPFSVLAQC